MIGSLILASGGFWDPIAKPLAAVLAYFYSLVPNYGIAIVMLTIAMMIVLTPLTIKQTRSMLVMQKLQPEMKKLQDLHKNDRQALNEAVMALYKEHNASPLGGCLPMLLPFPLFIALLRVLEGLSHTVKKGAVVVAEPKYLTTHTRMAQDIVKAKGQLDAFGMNLAKSARNVGGGLVHTLPFFILLLIMVGTQFYQQYQLTSKNPAVKSQPGQAMMMKFIPLFFGIISLNFPAGVVLYWTVSNIIRIGQQWALYRYDPKVKALVTKDVKEIEAKTREIDAREKATGKLSFRERLTGAVDTANDRKNQVGKNDAKPSGSATGKKGGTAGGAGRTPPGKGTNGTSGGGNKGRPVTGTPQPGAKPGGSAKPGATRSGGGAAKPGAPKGGAPRPGAPSPGVPSKPGLTPKAGTTRPGGPGAAKPGVAKPGGTGAPRPGIAAAATPKVGIPNVSKPGTAKPGAHKAGSGAPRPATPKSPGATPPGATPPGAKPANGIHADGKPADGKPAMSVPDTAKADGVNGDAAALIADPAASGIDAMPAAAGDGGADVVPTGGNGSPSKGRTGGGSARTVSSRRRKGR